MLLVKQMNCGWYVSVAGEFQLKQGEVCEAGSAWENALSVGRVSSSFGWPSLCSQTYFCTDYFTFHIIALPSSIYKGWACQCDALAGLSLESGTPAGFAWYHQVFGRDWSPRQAVPTPKTQQDTGTQQDLPLDSIYLWIQFLLNPWVMFCSAGQI